MPRFAPENHVANLKLLPAYRAIAQEAGSTPAQMALAWLLHQDEHIIPIPGTTRVEHLHDDLGAVNVRHFSSAGLRGAGTRQGAEQLIGEIEGRRQFSAPRQGARRSFVKQRQARKNPK